MQLCLWSIVSAVRSILAIIVLVFVALTNSQGQFWLSNRASFLACRSLLAILVSL